MVCGCTGDKTCQPHPADAAAAAKPQVARPVSAAQSPKSLVSPSRTTDVQRQGSKVAELSRRFSQALGLERQGSGASDASRQGSKISNLNSQGSVLSPQKASLNRQASTASSSVTSPTAPATSAAFARASPANPSLGQMPDQPAVIPDAAAVADDAQAPGPSLDESSVSIVQSSEHAGTSAADGPSQPVTERADDSGTGATPAALAHFPKIPMLRSREPTNLVSEQAEVSRQQNNILLGQSAVQQPYGSTEARSPRSNLPGSSEEVRIPVSARGLASTEQVQNTLTAVQQDYVQMIGEQEEERQALAAADLDATEGAAATSAYGGAMDRVEGASGDPLQNLIPALPLNPRPTAKRGNNALFQMLARGQSGEASLHRMYESMPSPWASCSTHCCYMSFGCTAVQSWQCAIASGQQAHRFKASCMSGCIATTANQMHHQYLVLTYSLILSSSAGDPQDMGDMFAAEDASGVNKRELYKQNKEAQLMERLERRMEGVHECPCSWVDCMPRSACCEIRISSLHGSVQMYLQLLCVISL